MRPTFMQNSKPLQHANVVFRAVTELSMRGYLVKRFSSAGELPSIEIDHPLEGVDYSTTKHAEKTFASAEVMGCRVYWPINPEVSPS